MTEEKNNLDFVESGNYCSVYSLNKIRERFVHLSMMVKRKEIREVLLLGKSPNCVCQSMQCRELWNKDISLSSSTPVC
jgi:hypothetical protein